MVNPTFLLPKKPDHETSNRNKILCQWMDFVSMNEVYANEWSFTIVVWALSYGADRIICQMCLQ